MTENAFNTIIENTPVNPTSEAPEPVKVTGIPLVYAAVEEATRALADEEHDRTPFYELVSTATGRDALLMYAMTDGDEEVMSAALGIIEDTGQVGTVLDKMLRDGDRPSINVTEGLRYLLENIVSDVSVAEQTTETQGHIAGLTAAFAFAAGDIEVAQEAANRGVQVENRLSFLIYTALIRGIRPAWMR